MESDENMENSMMINVVFLIIRCFLSVVCLPYTFRGGICNTFCGGIPAAGPCLCCRHGLCRDSICYGRLFHLQRYAINAKRQSDLMFFGHHAAFV